MWCSCELPENPDLAMAECDRCLRWYHFVCENLTQAESAEVVAGGGSYICRGCCSAMSAVLLGSAAPAGMPQLL